MHLVGKDDRDISSLEFCLVKNEDKWRIEIVKASLDARNISRSYQ